MSEWIFPLLVTLVSVLTVIVAFFLIILITTLIMLRKTLQKLQKAIDSVEDTAIRSLAPLLSLRSIVSDLGSFIDTVMKVKDRVLGKRKPKHLQ